jgi:hypothetical protein
VLDVLVCNWAGTYLGMKVCQYFEVKVGFFCFVSGDVAWRRGGWGREQDGGGLGVSFALQTEQILARPSPPAPPMSILASLFHLTDGAPTALLLARPPPDARPALQGAPRHLAVLAARFYGV